MAITTTALLLSPTRLIAATPLDGSVKPDLIGPAIEQAQVKYILPILGTDLYNYYKNALLSPTQIINPYEDLLENYIQPALIQFSFACLLPVLRLRFTKSSVTIMNSTQSSGASYEDLKPIINSYTDTGEFYRQRLIDYLCDNSNDFPEYSSNTGSDLNPSTNNYYPGINIERRVDENNLQLKSVLSAMGIK
tara:strand:+ start:4069 stop:4644 length:576 start_codon:yes stop_codon:yes gene_type:complete